MVLTEAIALGRPFVATHVGGTSDLAVWRHMLVKVGNPEALATALARYLTDPAVAAADASRAQALCAGTRSAELISARYREIYESC